VLNDLNIKIIYALSSQAKGKIERPYGWLQDNTVRTCARENISTISQGRQVLRKELNHYNYRQVHSTTQEVPYQRFKKAIAQQKSLFRLFKVPAPFLSHKDIFCYRVKRIIDPYRKISISNLQLKLNNATPRDTVDLRISPIDNRLAEIRCWSKNKLIDIHKVKISDLKGVHF